LGAERGISLFGLAAVFVDSVKHLAHVFDLFEESVSDINRTFLSGGEGETVAGASVDFHDFPGKFILLLQNKAGEISRVFQLGNDDALDGNAKAFENALNQVVCERPLLGGIAEEHPDDGAHVRFDVDNENFVVVAHE